MFVMPLPILAYVWWLYAGEPRGSYLWGGLADSLPRTKRFSPRQRRALAALIAGGIVWLVLFFLNVSVGAPALPGKFI
jgi:hypothetical protein